MKTRKHQKAQQTFHKRYLLYTNRIIINKQYIHKCKRFSTHLSARPAIPACRTFSLLIDQTPPPHQIFQKQLELILIQYCFSMQSSDSQIALSQTEAQFAKEIETSKKIELKIKEAIEKVGNAHRYQIILIVYLVLCFIFATHLLVGTSYFFMNPSFTCHGESTPEEEACKQLENCIIQNSYTITAYTELYCGDNIIARDLIQSMLGIGACLGVLFINFVSDYKGRKFSFIVSLITGILSTLLRIIGAYSRAPGIFYLSQILAGFCGNSLLTLVYVMSDHLMSKKYSSQCILITNAFFGAGEIVLILFTGPLNWEHLSILVMLIPSFGLLALSLFLVIQDPVFLFTKARYDDCKKSIEMIALFNDTKQHLVDAYEVIDQLMKDHVEMHYDSSKEPVTQQNSSKLKYLHLLLKRQIFVPILLIGLFNFGGNMTYYILSYSISDTGSSFGSEIALFGIVEFIGIFPMMVVGEKTPRKIGLLVIMVIHIIMAFCFFFAISTIVQTVLIVAIRFILTSTYMLYIFLVVETFPQHIQATSFGIVEFLSQMGKFFAPFMITLAANLNMSPILLTGFISLIFGIVTILPIKETLVKKGHESQKKESLLQNQSVSHND